MLVLANIAGMLKCRTQKKTIKEGIVYMSRFFKFDREPYNEGEQLYETDGFLFVPGVTVLVGCNGSGKTTLLRCLKERLKDDENTIVVTFDNLSDGGQTAISRANLYGNTKEFATLMTSSEGEQIICNIGRAAGTLGKIIRENADNKKDLFVLFDAIDSGMSVDNIIDVKRYLFATVLDDCKGKRNVYIICSANEYELCNGENCFDVYGGKYVKFPCYVDYKNFILQSRKIKGKR